MILLYSHGNSSVEYISTPEARGKVKPDKDLVQGLTLLTIPFNRTALKSLIRLGAKRYMSMDDVYVRKINLLDKEVSKNIFKVSLMNSATERKFIEDNPNMSKGELTKAKHAYLKKNGLVDLDVGQLTNATGLLKKEIEGIPIILNKILAGKVKQNLKTTLYVGLPYFRVVVRQPIKVTSNKSLTSKQTKESVDPVFTML